MKTEDDKEAILDLVINMLETQSFKNWHEEDFDEFVCNGNGCKSHDDIKDDLYVMLFQT